MTNDKTVGFIGGGRVARIMLGGFLRARRMPERVVVSDANAETLQDLKGRFPDIVTTPHDNRAPAGEDIVFLGLHPPVLAGVLPEIRAALRADSVVVSLAPKITIERLAAGLVGFRNLARVIPNAPSIVNAGYNPIAFAPSLPPDAKATVIDLLAAFGRCPEVPEEHLEAYAILTAMGPTYLWFQLGELQALGKSFGLDDDAVREGLTEMVLGAIRTMMDASLRDINDVIDLIPVRPLAEDEPVIRHAYRSRLTALYAKLKS
jgi:pyrroline-5-carboxylate reductase